jgi:hypothetical protein
VRLKWSNTTWGEILGNGLLDSGMLSGPSFGKYVVEQFSVDDSAADTVPISLDIVVLVADPFELHVSNYVDQGEKWRAAERKQVPMRRQEAEKRAYTFSQTP